MAALGALAALPDVRIGWSAPTPIRKLVFLMQENRSFDHYFGHFPGANGIPSNAPVTRASSPCPPSPPHDEDAMKNAYDVGRNDGFQTTAAMTFYTEAELPLYWALARRFTLCDAYFASVLGPTFPNRLFSLAASAGGFRDNPGSIDSQLLPRPTLVDRLDEAGRDWACYLVHRGGQTYNTIAYYPERAKDPRAGRPFDEFLTLATRGNLPDVSWIIADFPLNEHPPASIEWGQRFTGIVVDALFRSPQWPEMALILNWDEGGGFYDHVAPPEVGGSRYGFRVPCLVVSPHARAGHISHATYDHSSVVGLAERLFNLRGLGARDARADPLLECFDFDHAELDATRLPRPRNGDSCGQLPAWAGDLLNASDAGAR